MDDLKYEIGMVVENSKAPHWGPGKILDIRGSKLTIFFRSDFEKAFRTISADHADLSIAAEQSDPVLDNLPPFENGAFPKASKWVGLESGVERFLKQFSRAFDDPAYLDRERDYKMRSHALYEEFLGEGRGERLLAAGEIKDLSLKAHRVVSKDNNLLSPFENMALRDGLLEDERAASRFFESLFALIEAGPAEEPFEALANALLALPVKPGKARVATWPNLTILPALARPDRFVFLKPEPTKECANRLRFEIQYDSAPRWITYKKVLDLCDHLMEALRPHGARDYIDVQSFIWVIAKY